MLKSLRLAAALIAILATQISTAFLTSPASAADIITLNAQLKQAVCTQKWGEAVKIVDQIIAITPSSNQSQYNELKMHRVRMQNLSVSRTNVDNWLKSYCVASVDSASVASKDNNYGSTGNNNSSSVCTSSPTKPACEVVELLLGKEEFQVAMAGAVSAKPQQLTGLVDRCQNLVPIYLKSPGTARFPGKPSVYEAATGIYVTWGDVDAQNGFGALLRARYHCVFRNDPKTGILSIKVDVHS